MVMTVQAAAISLMHLAGYTLSRQCNDFMLDGRENRRPGKRQLGLKVRGLLLPWQGGPFYNKGHSCEAAVLAAGIATGVSDVPEFLLHVPNHSPLRLTMEKPELKIGRVPGQDIVLDDPLISRTHARLFWKEGGLFLEDLDSKHGSFVNGARVHAACPVTSCDEVSLGNVILRLEAVEPSRAPDWGEDSLALPVDTLRSWLGDTSQTPFRGWRKALDLLHEVSLQVLQPLSPERFLDDLLDRLFTFLDASRGAVLLRDEAGKLVQLASRTKERASDGPLSLSPATIEEAILRREALLLKEHHTKQPGSAALPAESVTSTVMAVPIEHAGEVLGLFYFDGSRARSPFTEEDLRFVASLGNLTAAKLLQNRMAESLRQAQKLQSLGSLAGGVAHDMNNVLGAIMGLATLEREQASEGSSLQSNMEIIARACERGSALVKGLLGFARQDLAEEKILDMNVSVREVVALLERTTLQKVRLETDLAEDLRPVKGDPAALSHMLMNLCVNAVDAMPEGGQLTICTRNEGAATVLLAVIDTGSGMPAEVVDKAMDPFFTTKPLGKGTGLGLSIVYATVKAHQGQIRIQSAPGQGTTVAIRIPSSEAPMEAPCEHDSHRKTTRSLRVLVVDDDELIQESTAEILAALGHVPRIAGGGEDVLRMLREGVEADVVLLDLNMPGMGGAAALPLIRSLRPELPVLLVTGCADQQAIDLARTVPGVTLLSKPYKMNDLRSLL